MKRIPATGPEAPLRPTFAAIYANELSFLRQSLRWLGVNEVDLEDVLQEILLAVYRGLGSFDPSYSQRSGETEIPYGEEHRGVDPAQSGRPDPLKRWLFGIAWRQVSHYRDRAHRRHEIPVGLHSGQLSKRIDKDPSPEQRVITTESLGLLGELLSGLKPQRRGILVLHDLLELSIADIAQELGINRNTAQNRLRLAREDFRAAVRRMGAEKRWALRAGEAPLAGRPRPPRPGPPKPKRRRR
jgi:RNA polymerase sigma-70 factor (ECF subfamily)